MPEIAIKYAIEDSNVLLCIWNSLKVKYGVDNMLFSRSNSMMLTLYKFPKRKMSMIDDKILIRSKLTPSNVFIFDKNSDMYESIWKWRNFTAKMIDRRVKFMMNDIELGNIVIKKPQMSSQVFAICKNASTWPINVINDL